MPFCCTGKNALGICDRCGMQFRLRELRSEVVAGVPNNLLVCSDCRDKDHPQLQPARYLPNMAGEGVLLNPRPDLNPGRGFFGWKPVGDPVSLGATAALGTVTVTIS